jgi:5-keto 4-deoxyuronate isomerase
MASELDRSVISNMWGSIGDISLDSNGQRKPSNWRKYVAADSAPIPETKRLVTLTNVVKAALAFSKTARKRALNKLIEEQSIDTRQVIQQERLRRLQSRSNILMSLSSQWSLDKDADGNGPFTLIEENNI